MQGIEKEYATVCIRAVISAYRALFEATAAEALSFTGQSGRYGKRDTIGFDAIPEIIIADRLKAFDRHSILITEELDEAAKKRWPTDSDPVRQPLMFFSDPVDRSKQLRRLIEGLSKDKPLQRLGTLMGRKKCIGLWEEMFEPPAAITGATTSITCVRKGGVIFSVVLNLISQTIFLASGDGIFRMKLPAFTNEKLDQIDFDYIIKHGRSLNFPLAKDTCFSPGDYKRFVTFLGKSGYKECFNDSMIFVTEPDDYLHHTEPGGPARILYLSELQKGYGSIGFILANGEKIGEWIHWLAFVKFCRKQGGQKLRVFEIFIERPWTKEGILMSTSPAYSIFCEDERGVYLDVSRLRNFNKPSKFRSMLVVTTSDNERIIHVMKQHGYREIHFIK